MPTSRQRSRSPFIANAVKATIGMCPPVACSCWRMHAVVS